MMTTILLSIGVFGLMMAALAVGYLLSGRCLTGSCSAPRVTRGDGETVCRVCGRSQESPKPKPEDTEVHSESNS